MNKRNNALLYSAPIVSLTIYTLLSFTRLVPFDVSHVIYVCQRYMSQLPHVASYSVGLLLLLSFISIGETVRKTKKFNQTLLCLQNHPKKLENIIKRYGILKKVIVIKDESPQAFCLGLFSPSIFISTGLIRELSKNELTAVLLHESEHAQKKHSLLSLLLCICEKILFFFPVISDLRKRFNIMIELDADYYAYSLIGTKRPILTALNKFLFYSPRASTDLLSFAQSSLLKYRIYSLTNSADITPAISKSRFCASVIVFIIVSSLYLIPATKTEIHTSKQDIVIFCLRNQTCLNQCTTETKASYL